LETEVAKSTHRETVVLRQKTHVTTPTPAQASIHRTEVATIEMRPGGRTRAFTLDAALLLLIIACGSLATLSSGSLILRVSVVLLALVVAGLVRRTVRSLEGRLCEARRLRNYRLVERLGRGGMGEVWRAEHYILPRPAAIKFIHPETLGRGTQKDRKEIAERFLREARATVRLSSPHTIEIYDFGVTPDGTLCYVMEFLDGLDLETLVLDCGPLPAARAVYLLRQVCISLAEAHEQNFVHRDIKPANIYVCRKGIHFDFVKVLDFGIATQMQGGTSTPEKAFEVVGTPAYMAPEIVLGRPPDARADIYSLGCVAYWLLTGQTVFGGDTVTEMVSHQVHTRPLPPSHSAGQAIPRDLELVVLKCLKKHPDDRFQSVSQLSQGLARCDVGSPWTPGQAMQWWRSRNAH
jgi:serine/threonine protein kinase